MTDEKRCKPVKSYVLAHKDARIKEARVVVIILHFKNFQYYQGGGGENLKKFDEHFFLCLCVLQKLGNRLDW